jgi:hypothetical protein
MNSSPAKGERPIAKTALYDRFLRSKVKVANPAELITELVVSLT